MNVMHRKTKPKNGAKTSRHLVVKPPPADVLVQRFPSRTQDVRVFLANLAAWLNSHRIGKHLQHSIELTLAEALNNVVKHALRDCPDKEITVRCRNTAFELAFTIEDFGAPMPGRKNPDGLPPEIEIQPPILPEGGFGWVLMRKLASEVHYERRGECNLLSLRFNFDSRISPAIHRTTGPQNW